MADTSQGEGWWQASDLKWYPPELHHDPEYRARYDQPLPSTPPAAPPVAPPAAAPSSAPTTPAAPTDPPAPADPGGVAMPPPGVPPGPRFEPIPLPQDAPTPVEPSPRRRSAAPPGESKRGYLFAGIGVALVGAIAAVVFIVASTGGDDDPADVAASTPTASTTTEQTATPTPGQDVIPGIDVTTSSVGTTADPAAFGEVYGWPEWRGTVVEVVDATEAGLVAEFDDPPADGFSHMAVIYEATYVGGNLSAFEPFIIDSPNATVEERFACILDTAALEGIGVASGIFELVPGQTVRLAICLEVATSDVDGLQVSLDNVNVFEDPVVFGPGGSLLEPLDPPPLDAADRSLDTVPYGTLLEDEGWQGTVVEVFDANEAGVVSEFAEPPPEGSRFLAVVYEVTNATDEDADFIPIRVTGIGSAVFEAFNACFLNAEAIAERNVEINRFELAAGESVRVASCLEVPAEEASTFVVRIQNSFATNGILLLFPGLGG